LSTSLMWVKIFPPSLPRNLLSNLSNFGLSFASFTFLTLFDPIWSCLVGTFEDCAICWKNVFGVIFCQDSYICSSFACPHPQFFNPEFLNSDNVRLFWNVIIHYGNCQVCWHYGCQGMGCRNCKPYDKVMSWELNIRNSSWTVTYFLLMNF
jgi:hypothetical protein